MYDNFKYLYKKVWNILNASHRHTHTNTHTHTHTHTYIYIYIYTYIYIYIFITNPVWYAIKHKTTNHPKLEESSYIYVYMIAHLLNKFSYFTHHYITLGSICCFFFLLSLPFHRIFLIFLLFPFNFIALNRFKPIESSAFSNRQVMLMSQRVR